MSDTPQPDGRAPEEYPGPVIALLTMQAERDERWVEECRKFPTLHTPSEIREFEDDVNAYRAHIAALTALDRAVHGCGRVQSYWAYPNTGLERSTTTCGSGILALCCDCVEARHTAIQALLGRTK